MGGGPNISQVSEPLIDTNTSPGCVLIIIKVNQQWNIQGTKTDILFDTFVLEIFVHLCLIVIFLPIFHTGRGFFFTRQYYYIMTIILYAAQTAKTNPVSEIVGHCWKCLSPAEKISETVLPGVC